MKKVFFIICFCILLISNPAPTTARIYVIGNVALQNFCENWLSDNPVIDRNDDDIVNFVDYAIYDF